ncbi:Fic family protein [Kiloniella laminariae]|uniref:Fic family protein n=1 Tax=Kiloniella laminariae TaxID=454162 RepID=A0ABT4LF45_9PROT|nr:Fic family protein [Kiloniella laminariae]MCZ4279733.1 Fic family protein [Kiloniella laminariae]
MSDPNRNRHTVAQAFELVADPEKKARIEARNVLLQYDMAKEMVESGFGEGAIPFVLRSSHILRLHQRALKNVETFAGTYRNTPVEISKSKHTPPESFEVALLIEEMCNYIKSNGDKTPVHLSAYAMWRLNWIHPFSDGNGRTSRIISYMVLCNALGHWVPGTRTIPDMIADNRKPYYEALESADSSLRDTEIVDLTELEELLANLLSRQLVNVLGDATGSSL